MPKGLIKADSPPQKLNIIENVVISDDAQKWH